MNPNETKLSDQVHKELTTLLAKPQSKFARPPLYKVMLVNDDFTPMDFVVSVLKQFFHKAHVDAMNLMLEIHNQGSAICGVFTRDVAETKIEQVIEDARKNQHPLQCIMEKE